MKFHTFRGKIWAIVFRALHGKEKGWCDGPHVKQKKIIVSTNQPEQKELEYTIHEALHACLWDLDEEAIHSTAADIARFLWRLGYRKEKL